jgi:hypothetical protein
MVTAALLAPAPLAAQVNIEMLRGRQRAEGWHAELAGALTLRGGNRRQTDLDVSGRLDWVRGAWNVFYIARADVGFAGGRQYSEAGLHHVRAVRTVSTRLAVEAFTQLNYDTPQRLRWRSLLGGGARLRVLRLDSGSVHLGTSAMYEHERLDLPDTARHPRQTDVLRWSSYLSARLALNAGVAVVIGAYGQPRFDEPGDVRAILNATLVAPLGRVAGLTATVTWRYDSRPPADVRRYDFELRQGVTVAF